MKIKSVQLKNFKRFTDLTLKNIPEQAKLILLIGANGSGKSSIFDGFRYAVNTNSSIQREGRVIRYSTIDIDKIRPLKEKQEYYSKTSSQEVNVSISLDNNELIDSTETKVKDWSKKFIGRSSNRIIPKIPFVAVDLEAIESDFDSPVSSIENDARFINDIMGYLQQINTALRRPLFLEQKSDTGQIFKELIEPLNKSLKNIFGENNDLTLSLIDIEDAIAPEPAKLIFKKGHSRINYDLLSHGEKQVIVLLLNFIVRKKQYEDAIIYIDEMDCHLNTALQETLLKEIVEKWIPDSSQLWTASHALGFIDYARKTDNAVILDFDSLNFDIPQVITPQSKEVLDVYDLAIPKSILSQLFSDKKIVFCENKNDEYYNLMGLEKTLFVGVKDSRDVFLNAKNDNLKFTLRDRDFISDSEIERIQSKYPNHRILKYYDFENYLYHPDNIAELNPLGFDKLTYEQEILSQKKEKIPYILTKVESARKTYEEFKTEIKPDDSTKSIVDDFMSDDFERFYKFFDMKEQFNRISLAPFNLTVKELASTNWFKKQIEQILL
jgi:recombinational DNA repair ATPase RecF